MVIEYLEFVSLIIIALHLLYLLFYPGRHSGNSTTTSSSTNSKSSSTSTRTQQLIRGYSVPQILSARLAADANNLGKVQVNFWYTSLAIFLTRGLAGKF